METWVLIIWITAAYKGSAVTVPGYATQQECVTAGEAAAVQATRVFCVPGPRR